MTEGLMRGANKLVISHATMRAAIQRWLEEEMKSKVVVAEVREDRPNRVFEVLLRAPEDGTGKV